VDDALTSQFVISMLQMAEVKNILHVGSAISRSLDQFAAALPGTLVCGDEPVAALINQGIVRGVT
jgi:hypothetical protein